MYCEQLYTKVSSWLSFWKMVFDLSSIALACATLFSSHTCPCFASNNSLHITSEAVKTAHGVSSVRHESIITNRSRE